jgi:hypothetical protein
MSTVVYSEVVRHFDNTTDAINHFSPPPAAGKETTEGKFPWGIIFALMAVTIIGGLIYLYKKNQEKNKQCETPPAVNS